MYYMYENWQAGPHKAVVHVGTCGFCKDGNGRAGGNILAMPSGMDPATV
jgi:hypothetical protein